MPYFQDVLKRVDGVQRRHPPAAFAFAVNKKYGDDRGGNLAALVAYYGFLSMFPLLLAVFTIATYALRGHPATIHSLTNHLGEVPVIGPSLSQIDNQSHPLGGSVLALVVGIVGLVLGAMGLAQSLQHVMNEVWGVPGRERAGYATRLARSAGWYAAFGIGIVASTFVTSLSSVLDWGPAGPVLSSLPAALINVAVFTLSFQILSPHGVTWRMQWRGAVVAGLAWTVLTTVGVSLVTHQLKHASALYGTFGSIIGLIGFLYVAARGSIYGCEMNAVRHHKLWPRSLVPPLTAADKQALIDLARKEERMAGETVRVEF
ncbi:MAG: YihY/virulence factor BrkB family protein [Acidimicrobiales bacterium]